MDSRKNNFDFLRLLFASFVVFSHSYPLSNESEILSVLSNEQVSFGDIAVSSFFIISGFLIFNSLNRSKSFINYIWKRIIRIFPALIVLLLITMLILPLLYEGDNIFVQKDYWSYFYNNLYLYFTQYNVNGVFENNVYPKAINGSLWTLPYEFSMYLILLFIFPFKKKKYIKYLIIFIFLLSLYIYVFHNNFLGKRLLKHIHLNPQYFYRLFSFFIAGSVLTFFNLRKINNYKFKLFLFTILIVCLLFNIYKYISLICLPLLIILIGISNNKHISKITDKLGDISYGVYIYSFLIQQILMNYFNLNYILLFVCSLPITYIIAYFSWNLVEKRALIYKNKF